MKSLFTLFLMIISLSVGATDKNYTLLSPNKKIKIEIKTGGETTYSVFFKDTAYLLASPVALKLLDGTALGRNTTVTKAIRKSQNQVLKPLYGISSTIKEHYNELALAFKGNYRLVFRAYNEGVAYRFETSFKNDLIVLSEQSDFKFTDNYPVYFHPALSEAEYRLQKINDIKEPNYSSLPVLIKPNNGINILVHESDVFNYPCLSIKASGDTSNTLKGLQAKYPKRTEAGGYSNYNLVVKEEEKFIAKTAGNRTFPWRLIAFAETDGEILTNQLVYLLAANNRLEDTSWIKPGKVAWDWWHANNLSGVPFKTGFNTETYKYYIDFAAENNIPYVNLDEGWSDPFDLMKVTDKLDISEVINYAKKRNVKVILWCVWYTLDRQMIEALDQFEKWGIAGVKVDFMDRDDQIVVEFQERLLKEAGKRKMLVDYHGVYHPNGLPRTYPNNINNEGVRGLEWNKFSEDGVSPLHDVTLPFIRMFAGAMDYTPGAMNNYNKADWKAVFARPNSQGTRCHQLAMYIIYYAPLQMISDAPTSYQKEPKILNFISAVPTVWDKTVPLHNKAGEYVAVARKKDNTWYIGAMTNWDGRSLNISLNFLGDGEYMADIFEDGPNAHRIGSDYNQRIQKINKKDSIKIDMAPGGGWAAIIKLK